MDTDFFTPAKAVTLLVPEEIRNNFADKLNEWIKRDTPLQGIGNYDEGDVRCPVCNAECNYDTIRIYNFCPNCGQRIAQKEGDTP